jgi:hypothetical protein
MQGWLWWFAGAVGLVVLGLAIALIVAWVLGYAD